VLEHLTSTEKLALAASPYPSARALVEDARLAVADAVLSRTAPGAVVRTRADFERVRDALSAAVVDETFHTVSLAARILTGAREADRALRSQNSLTLLGALNDVKGQIAGLVFPRFVSASGWPVSHTCRDTCVARKSGSTDSSTTPGATGSA
jgi:ATP-dependent helicase HrpA